MSQAEAQKIARKYVQKLKAEKFPFSAVYLFGSQAKRQSNKWSDIDIAVVSENLEQNWNENEDLLWKYVVEVDPRIEPIGFAPKDFEDDESELAQEIKKSGIEIKI